MTAETATPGTRAYLGVLNIVLLGLGTLLADIFSRIVEVEALAIVDVVAITIHFIAAGFLHPETPR